MTPVELLSPTPEILNEIGRLRVLAWKSSQPKFRDMDVWLDALDSAARHWLVRYDGRIVAAGRLSVHSSIQEIPDAGLFENLKSDLLRLPIASLNRLVVHPDFRGKGISAELDRIRIQVAMESGCGCIVGVCRDRRRVSQLGEFGLFPLANVFDPDRIFDAAMVTIVVRSFDENHSAPIVP